MDEDTTTNAAPVARDPWAMIGIWLTVALLCTLVLLTARLADRVSMAEARIADQWYRLGTVETKMYAIPTSPPMPPPGTGYVSPPPPEKPAPREEEPE